MKNKKLIAAAVCFIAVLSILDSSYGMTRSKTETISNFKSLCDSHSGVASYESLGKSVENEDIWIFRFGNPNGDCVMWDGQLHGNEDLGSECMWLFAQWLLGGSTKANGYLQTNYILFVPSVNIDSSYRCNMRRSYTAAEGGPLSAPYGVNLNRNFPLGFGGSGSPDPDNEVDYRGINGGSEPETKAMINAFAKYKPKVYVNTHQWGGPSALYSSSANIAFVNQIIQVQQQYYNSTHPTYGTIDITPYRMHMGLAGGMAAYQAQEMNVGITAFLLELDPQQGFAWENRGGSWRQPSTEVIQGYYYPKFEMLMLATLDASSNQSAHSSGYVFEDNFNSGDFSKWTGTDTSSGETATVSTRDGLPVAQGGLSARFTTNGGSQVEHAYCYKTLNEEEVWASGSFYASSGLLLGNDGDKLDFLCFMSGQNCLATVGIGRLNGGDAWVLESSDGSDLVSPIYSSSPTVEINRWYCLELHWKKHPTLGAVEAFVDGERILWIEDTDTAAFGNVSQVDFGLMLSLQVQKKVSLYGDCFSISDMYEPYAIGDSNHDGSVNVRDISVLIENFLSTPYQLEWDPRADLNRNGIVNIRDVAIVCIALG